MGDATRRKKIALANGEPWPPNHREQDRSYRKKWTCGKCGYGIVQLEMPVLACRCGAMMWNCMQTPRNPPRPAKEG